MQRNILSAFATLASGALLSLLPRLAAAQTPITVPPLPPVDPVCVANLQLFTLGLAHPAANSFSTTCGGLFHERSFDESPFVTLSDGTVLIAGGTDYDHPNGAWHSEDLAEAELYLPAAGIFVPTGNMAKVRSGHSVTLLHTGNVLVVGGGSTSNLYPDASTSAELYNPLLHLFLPAAPPTRRHVGGHSATLLDNGKVLVAGGMNCPQYFCLASAAAELYDPSTNTWTAAGGMHTARAWHTATLLSNGKVLVAGGFANYSFSTSPALASAELYDPASNTFTPTGGLNAARGFAAAALLRDGRVLIQAGSGCNSDLGGYCVTVDIYDPAPGKFLPYGPLTSGAFTPAVVPLPNGKALLIGPRSPQLFDPSTNGFTPAGAKTPGACPDGTAALLPNGQVLMQGTFGAACISPAPHPALLYTP